MTTEEHIIIRIQRVADRVPEHIQYLAGYMVFFQLADHRPQFDCQCTPQQKKLILLGNPEPRKPSPHRVDSLSGAAVGVIEHILHLNWAVFQSFSQINCIGNHPSQREQCTDRRLTLMDRAESVLQEGADLVLAARYHVYGWDFGRAADVGFGILVDNLLRCHLKLPGNVKDIPAVEQDRVLMLAAFAAFPAFELELGIEIHRLPLDFFRAALFC